MALLSGSSAVLPAFQAWMDSVGITYSDALRLVNAAEGCSGLALGVQATRAVTEGERLCTIPKAACLSIRTSELADVIEAEELGGGLGLVLAVMHEMALGPRSKWHGYFQALPAREYLPLFWSDAQLEGLKGTELETRSAVDRQAAAEDFEEHVLPLVDKYPGRLSREHTTLGSFHVAASFVASRAFGVDEWHGDAMVPLADIFNHKASVVELGEEYEVHGAGSSSDEEEREGEEREGSEEEEGEAGEEGEGEDSGSEEGEEEGEQDEGGNGSEEEVHEGEEKSGAGKTAAAGQHEHHAGYCGSGLEDGHKQGAKQGHGAVDEDAAGNGAVLPSVMGNGPASIYGIESANGLHLRLEMGIVDRDEETLEIVAASPIPAGAEVHNTYGELGNSELVKKYGFALRQNPFTAVALDKARLLGAAQRALGARPWHARSQVLAEQTEVLEEDEEPFEVLPNGHISPALFVALRVLGATNAELAGWEGIQDTLRPPPAATTAQAAAASGGGGGGGKPQQHAAHKDEEEEEEEEFMGSVQVWPVLGADGTPLPAGSEAAADAATAAAAKEQRLRRGHAALLPVGMWRLLQSEVRQRVAAYSAPLETDLRQLAELEQQQAQQGQQAQQQHEQQQKAGQKKQKQKQKQQGGSGEEATEAAEAAAAASEERAAHRAALLLRITEQEVLRDLLAALEQRLAAMGAFQEGEERQAVAGTAVAAGKVKGKGKRKAAEDLAAGKGKGKQAAVAQQAVGGKSKGQAAVPAAGRKSSKRKAEETEDGKKGKGKAARGARQRKQR